MLKKKIKKDDVEDCEAILEISLLNLSGSNFLFLHTSAKAEWRQLLPSSQTIISFIDVQV